MPLRHRTFFLGLLLLAGCFEEEIAAKPDPQALTRDAIGHYCGMVVADHEGPKGQILVEGRNEAIWFSSVRDTLAFTRLPEETAKIRAIYVSDMGKAESWRQPGEAAWMDADDAVFVVGSSRSGGMGAPEVVPFAEREMAERFAQEHGGHLMKLADIPDDALIGAVEIDGIDYGDYQPNQENMTHESMSHDSDVIN